MISWLRQSTRLRIALTLSGDLLLAYFAYRCAFVVRYYFALPWTADYIPLERFGQVHHYWATLCLSQAVFLYFFGMYDYPRLQRRTWVMNIPAALGLQTIFITSLYFFKGDFVFPRSVFPVFWILNVLLVAGWRLVLAGAIVRAARRKVLIVGTGEGARGVIREIEQHPWMGYQIVGLLGEAESARPNGPAAAVSPRLAYPVLGTRDELATVLQQNPVDEIILAPDRTLWQDRLIDSLGRWTHIPASIVLVPSVFEMLISKTQHLKLRDIPLVEIVRDPFQGPAIYLKHLVDFILALAVALLSLPVMVLAAAVIYLDSGRPVIYKQLRVGKDQRPFVLFKFRTMRVDAEVRSGAVLATPEDSRRTRIGAMLRKLRVDEFPQLVNILRGEMSFIGPRPERPEFVRDFLGDIPGYAERFRMKPGITGLAQVHGDYHTSAENKLRYDLVYVYNYSLWMDLWILIETVKTMIGRLGT